MKYYIEGNGPMAYCLMTIAFGVVLVCICIVFFKWRKRGTSFQKKKLDE